MKTCPKCGGTLFHRNYRAMGWWQQLIDCKGESPEVVDTFLDNLKNGREPKTMGCADCKTRVPNPDYYG